MDDSNESEIDWEREYHVINNKMKQFHLKAAKAREKIYKQMEELKAKTLAAEERAENAETELCLLRESLSGNNKAVDVLEKMNKERLMLLEEQCFKLEIQKAHLQESLSKELQARKRDKETLQEKSTKIKQWVMQTLRIEAEEKNFLRDAKKQLELQVEDLQGQIQEILEREGSRILDVNSMNSSKQSTVRSNSSIKKIIEEKCEDLNLVPASKESSSSPSPMDLDEISNIHDGEFPMRATNPQQVPSEAVRSWENSSINRAINQLGEQCNNVTFDPNPNITFINPPPPPPTSSGTTSGGMRHLPSSIRRRLQSLADRGREEKKRISDSKNRNETPTFGRSCPTPMMQTRSKSTFSREEMITLLPVAQENPDFSRSLPSASFRKARRNNGRPPTPPRHQHAVWESKIYSLTKTGFQFSSNALGRTLPSKHIASTCEEYEPGEYAHVVHRAQPLTVPVYTKIKGRAQQIRHEPLSTSSSESSDDDVQATCVRHKRNSRGGGGMNQSTSATTPRIPKGLTSLEAAAAIAGCSLSSSNNSAAVVPRGANGSPSVARAIKRANSQQSMTSVESDYAIPPDAYGSNSSLVVESSEPEYKLLKTSPKPETGQQATSGASFVASTRVSRGDANGSDVTSLQKLGYLKKLGGRSRTWKKRWFMLQDGKLVYYKASADPCCNVPGHHVFDIVVSNASVVKNSTSGMSFQVSACDRTYYLAASSPQQAEDWVKALNGVINARKSDDAATAEGLSSKNGDKLNEHCIKCKVVRVVDGDSAIMWAIVNHNWLEFRSEVNFNELRFDRVDLRHCVIDDDPSNAPKRLHAIPDVLEQNYVVSLRDVGSGKPSSSETLLYFEHMSDKTNWMTVMNANSTITKITPFDKLVMQVLEKAKDKSKQLHLDDELWFNSILVHSNDIDYNQPLTSLKSDGIAVEASKLAKAIQRFANHELEAASTDFHVTIAQCIANTCMTHVQLRDELYAQLFRSTNRRETDKKRSKSSSYLQSWKLVALLTPLFIPSTRMMTFFKIHLQRHADSRSEVGQYASYCQRSIDRTSHAGPRVAAPSRTESVSILMHNPFHHSLPFSVPVHFDDGSYQVIGFHGSTTVSDFTRSITTQGGIRNLPTSGFALFVNDPEASCSFEHFIDPPVKVCDVISAWENAARRGKVVTPACMPAVMSDAQAATADEKGANGCNILRLVGSPRFVLRRRLCFKSHRCLESNFERLLIIHQIGEKIAKDRFPVSRDLALELTALTAQIVLGAWRPDSTRALIDVIDRIFPARYRDARGKHCPKQQREKIIEKWTALKETSRNECMRTFLNAVRRWPLCEATFFAAKNETCGKHKGDAVWIAVEEECLNLLHYRTMQVIDQIEYEHIATFGGCRNKLMVVVQKLGSPAIKKFFLMPKIQIFSCVQLMADYINSSIKPDLNVF